MRKPDIVGDIQIIAASAFLAIILGQSDIFRNFLAASQEIRFLGSFIAGIFYTSMFTTVPATVIIVLLARSTPLSELAILGGLGAALGDLLIFRFLRDTISEDISYFFRRYGSRRFIHSQASKLARPALVALGAVIIASPLPDEIGLTMMGVSKIPTVLFLPISFVLNALGILVIGLVAHSIN